jgi:hypothetical protein
MLTKAKQWGKWLLEECNNSFIQTSLNELVQDSMLGLIRNKTYQNVVA